MQQVFACDLCPQNRYSEVYIKGLFDGKAQEHKEIGARTVDPTFLLHIPLVLQMLVLLLFYLREQRTY
jgi:hypothetical protein